MTFEVSLLARLTLTPPAGAALFRNKANVAVSPGATVTPAAKVRSAAIEEAAEQKIPKAAKTQREIAIVFELSESKIPYAIIQMA